MVRESNGKSFLVLVKLLMIPINIKYIELEQFVFYFWQSFSNSSYTLFWQSFSNLDGIIIIKTKKNPFSFLKFLFFSKKKK